MPLTARRHLRKMRGGAQSHLLEADDGHFYVVKFQGNPQHRRILVNELIASVILQYLQISTPQTALIRVTPEFLAGNPEVYMQLGTRHIAVEPGWHFGSRHPGDPSTMAIYDFVPDSLLAQVNNLGEFLGALVFDKWAGNADGRQSIFFRAQLKNWLPETGASPRKLGFVALMIDHGFAFNGPHWTFADSPVQGLYSRKMVYHPVRSLSDFEPWLERVIHFPEQVIDQATRRIPPEWLEGDEEELEKVLEHLLRRRKRVPDLISDSRQAKTSPFPNWQ
ncbi:MAG: HipA family kinase [Bryobacteraceae bacterium]